MPLLKMVLALLFTGKVVTVPEAIQPASIDELMTFECARQVVELIPENSQTGPVFLRDGVLISSTDTSRGEKLLMVNAGSGTFAVPLFGLGVSRLHFKLPAINEERSYFISYSHGGGGNSRLYELTVGRPPGSKDETDFELSRVRRAPDLLPHFEFALYETIERIVTHITDKKIPRHELGLLRPNVCDHISRRAPALARIIRYDLDMIATVIQGPMTPQQKASVRAPASVASSLLGK